MKNLKKIITVIGVFLMISANTWAQTNVATNNLSLGLPELNLIASSASTINLQLTTTTAGQAVEASKSDSSTYVQISSVVSSTQTRSLSAEITNGVVPAGTKLSLVAQSPNANFAGTGGTLGSQVLLSSSSADIVTLIGSCYSGVTSTDGYRLKYTWGLDNPASTYGAIRATAGASIVVTITLSAGI